MRILGIDPGYATIGFGLIEGERAQYRMVTYGAITTPAGLPLSKRLYQIDRDMEAADRGQLKPDADRRGGAVLQTRISPPASPWPMAVACIAAAPRSGAGVPLFEYTPMQVKHGRRRLRQGGEAAGHGYDQAAAEIGENTPAR